VPGRTEQALPKKAKAELWGPAGPIRSSRIRLVLIALGRLLELQARASHEHPPLRCVGFAWDLKVIGSSRTSN
jgi:hypothetical protein